MQPHTELFGVPDRDEIRQLETRAVGNRSASDSVAWEIVPLSSEAAGVPSLPEVKQLDRDRAA